MSACRWVAYSTAEDKAMAVKNNPPGILRTHWHKPECQSYDWSDCYCERTPAERARYERQCEAADRSLEDEHQRRRRELQEVEDAAYAAEEAETERLQAEWRQQSEERKRCTSALRKP